MSGSSITTNEGQVWAVKAKGQNDRWKLRVIARDDSVTAAGAYYDTDDMRYVLVGSARSHSTLCDVMHEALRDVNARVSA